MKNLFLIKRLNSFLNHNHLIFLITNSKKMEPEQQNVDDFDQEYRIPFTEVKRWKQYLSENGFVVIKNFLTKETCQKYMVSVW